MSKIRSSKVSFVDVAGVAYVGTLPPDYEIDDWLFWYIYTSGSTAVTTASPGWSVYTADAGGFQGGGLTCHLLYKKVTVANEPPPQADNSASVIWCGNMIAVKAAPGTSPVAWFGVDFDVDSGQDFPTTTPTTTDNLLIWGWAIDSTQSRSHDDFLTLPYLDGLKVDGDTADVHAHWGFDTHLTATAITPPSSFFQNNIAAALLIIKDDGNAADVQGYIADPGCQTLLSGFNRLYPDYFIDAGATVEDPTIVGETFETATINGHTVNYSTLTESNNIDGSWTKQRGIGIIPRTLTVGLNVYRVNYNVTTFDASGNNFIGVNIPIKLDYSLSDDGLLIVLEDGSKNWSAYNITEEELGGVGVTDYYWKFQPSTVTPLASSATLPNLAALTKMTPGHFYNGQSSISKRPSMHQITLVTGPVVLGGGGSNGLRAKDVHRILYGMPMEHALLQGRTQLYLEHGLQCGNNSVPCKMDFRYDAIEVVDNTTPLSQISNGVIEIVMGAADNAGWTLSNVSGIGQYNLTVPVPADPLNPPDNIIVGPIIGANDISLRAPCTVEAGCLFSQYLGDLVTNDCGLTAGIVIDGGGGISNTVSVDSVARFENLHGATLQNFTGKAALELTGNHAAVTANGMTFTANGTKIRYTGTTNLTISADVATNLTPGTYPATTNNAEVDCPNAQIIVTAPQLTLTIDSNIDLTGAEVRLYDADGVGTNKGTEITGVESNPSPTFSTTLVTAGNLIYIQIIQLGYEEFEQSFTMGSSSQTFTALREPEVND